MIKVVSRPTVVVRSSNHSDIEEQKLYHERDHKDFDLYPLEAYTKCLTAVNEEGKVIGVGGIIPRYEIVLSLNQEFSKREKLLAVIKLLTEGLDQLKEEGFRDCYAFVEDPEFEKLLSRFGFQRTSNPALFLKVR